MMMKGMPDWAPRRSLVSGLTVAVGTLLVIAACFSQAASADSLLFEPVLSLTGGCGTTKLDSVKDPWCPGPPAPSPFASPSITIDSFGDMYVASHEEGPGGHVSVFSPAGKFLTEIPASGPKSLAVDSKGNLYVFQFVSSATEPILQVTLFSPSQYKPASEEVTYNLPGEVVTEDALWSYTALAVDPTTNRLFISSGGRVEEWSSAEAGNELLDSTIGQGTLADSKYLAVDSSHNRLYVADDKEETEASTIEAFELTSPHNYVGMLNGDATPEGKFLSNIGLLTIDVDEETGNIFVSDLAGKAKNWNVYELGPGLGEAEELLATYQHGFEYVEPGEIAVDNSASSPNHGTLYVPSSGEAVYHTYAFKSSAVAPAEVEAVSASGITETEAVLQAAVNPAGGTTHYRFEYTTREAFEEREFDGALVAGDGILPAGIVTQDVSAALTGLDPGQAYNFRIRVENDAGQDQGEGGFRTYPSSPLLSCPNEISRTGPSAALPDCRAYELVTPPDTNGRSPKGVGAAGGTFPTLQASSDGGKVSFRTEGGSLPGSEGSGAFNGEWYLATRGTTGWSTKIAAPDGTEAVAPSPGSVAPDQEHSFWQGELEGETAWFVRYPDGHSDLVGRGSLGSDPNVEPDLITTDAAHIIFTDRENGAHQPQQLEENAPPTGTDAVYDRTSDEVTHVVSLLPASVTPGPGEDALYVGASADGRGVAFTIGGTLYMRRDNAETYKVGKGVTYAGVAEGGSRIFYVEDGNLLALDVGDGETISFAETGNAVPVYVAPDGTDAYFLSPSVLNKEEENPNGQIAKKGQQNLYLSREGEIRFVGIVTSVDVSQLQGGGDTIGLGQWTESLRLGKPGLVTARTTPNGSVLLFESRAVLTEYDSDGHVEIYRYDSVAGTLTCLSCNPTEAAATGDASLQSVQTISGPTQFMSTHALVPNLRPDGKRAFFQSSEALIPKDVDGLLDVYEWEAPGIGSCQRGGGCVYLISSGQSNHADRLFAASESGDDVYFLTSDILVGSDQEEVPSIYDARVGGGFPEGVQNPCQGEGCRPGMSGSPDLTQPSTQASGGNDNVQPRRCPKGKHKVKRHGRTRCVEKRHHHRHVKTGKKGGRSK